MHANTPPADTGAHTSVTLLLFFSPLIFATEKQPVSLNAFSQNGTCGMSVHEVSISLKDVAK